MNYRKFTIIPYYFHMANFCHQKVNFNSFFHFDFAEIETFTLSLTMSNVSKILEPSIDFNPSNSLYMRADF